MYNTPTMGQESEVSCKYNELVEAINHQDIHRGWQILIEITQLLFSNYDLFDTSNNPDKHAFHKDMQKTMGAVILLFEIQFPQQTIENSNTLNENGLFIQNARNAIERFDVIDDMINDDEMTAIFHEMIEYMTRKYIENLTAMR